MHNRRWDNAVNDIVSLKNEFKQEASTRQVEDVDLLDTVIETQTLLQQTVIISFIVLYSFL